MRGEELFRTYVMIAKCKKPFGLHDLHKNILAL